MNPVAHIGSPPPAAMPKGNPTTLTPGWPHGYVAGIIEVIGIKLHLIQACQRQRRDVRLVAERGMRAPKWSKADMCSALGDVRFGPIADIAQAMR
jgi:hypothetical protein